jgi:S1-C subfamily serine protease
MFCIHCGKEIKDQTKYCTECGVENFVAKATKKRRFLNKKSFFVFLGVITFVIISVFLYSLKEPVVTKSLDIEIASSVVNIYCDNGTDEGTSGGSGTIMTEDGLVLTNAHIIPETVNEDTAITCMVILPDPTTGAPSEIYQAYPIVLPEISEKYDLAFVQIDDVFVDDEGTVYGDYPKIFPAYDDMKYCKSGNVILGEPIKIYGYPAISGRYALTITDGIVSSLLADEGLIITSAKISHGNSGGLAVDQYGCRIGIPSMVNSDENESLGVIISNNLISDFTDEVNKILKK